jgi:hypothetical protein
MAHTEESEQDISGKWKFVYKENKECYSVLINNTDLLLIWQKTHLS